MKLLKTCIFFFSLMASSMANSTIYWVGSSAACTGSNVFSTYAVAEAVAAGNGTPSDEIRLTRTIDFTGGRGAIQIREEFGSSQVTISGGYDDCFSSQSGRTLVGSSTVSSFDIDTGNQASTIILKNLTLAFNDSRGVVARGNVFIQLDNVEINNNGYSGLDVGDGAIVEVLANSSIRFNENFNNPFGGGVRCTGTNSSVIIHGRLEKNRAQKGANLFVSTGCYAVLKDGMRIIGDAIGTLDADQGAGAYVDNGGELFADGRANRVIFENNEANDGGGLYLNGTGFAVLQNTHFNANFSFNHGATIYAINGGNNSPQLIMDQTTNCSLLFRCSEIQNSLYVKSVVYAANSLLKISRTVIEKSQFAYQPTAIYSLLASNSNATIQLNRVGIINNEVASILSLSSDTSNHTAFEIAHLTAAGNYNSLAFGPYSIFTLYGVANVENSIFTDTVGAEDRGGSIIGRCNLVDNQTDWPFGSYHVGSPALMNLAGGDARQLAHSVGVDMCLQNSFGFSDIDIENQAAPVNENTNPQGMPGDVGGLFDAGFDEVYDNIGSDEFLLTVIKEGSGEGVVISNPAGIACGIDCSEVFFNGTIVTLNASPITGNEFVGWSNCPLVNQAGQCLTNVQSSHTIRAVFQPDDLIFADGFE